MPQLNSFLFNLRHCLSGEQPRFETLRVKRWPCIGVEFIQIVPSCDHWSAVIFKKAYSVLSFKCTFGKFQVKDEQDFVTAFVLVGESIFQHHWPRNNGNLGIDFFFEFSDDSILCCFAELNATA